MRRDVNGAAALLLACAPLHAAADAKAGEEKAPLCLLCHKPGPSSRFTPLLEQQPAAYLARALKAYKSGERQQTSMTINAASLSATDINDLSAYFAAKPFPRRAQELDPAKVAEGGKLLAGADCATCHAPAFTGNGTTPALAGQTYLYLLGRMTAFRNGGGAHPSPMTAIKDDTDAERAASYLASLR